jgi:hypothetical protein
VCRTVRLRAGAALLVLAAACSAAPPRRETVAPPPRRRSDGPRSTPFAGGDPGEKGWTKVDGVLWVESAHADELRRGLLWDGERTLTVAEADALPRTPEKGYVLRTDHVRLETDVPFARARERAAACERHVALVLEELGEALDLRLPADPLRVVLAAKREAFERLLARDVPEGVSWGAFYRAADGTVYACEERRAEGGLPVLADLRHEITHALLDLGRPEDGRAALFGRPQFWAWEAAAVWTESLGDPPGAGAGDERLVRFRRRRAWGEATPVADLLLLTQPEFTGRHYDQTASFVGWLLRADGGSRRAGFHRLLREVMAGRGERDGFEKAIGLSPAEAERRWTASLDPE